MKKRKVTDESILFDLEFKGIDSFLSDMREGFFVPKCFANRIKNIVKTNYEIELAIDHTMNREKQEGHFCLMPYNDELVLMKSKQ